jgi:DNA-directed RNA polymerase subunit E'/Rpb7
MEVISKQKQQKFYKKKDSRVSSIYSRCLITRSIVLPITAIGKNIKETIELCVSTNFEGKCVVEGFIKPNSSKIITHSSGVIFRGNFIKFEVVFECEICFPVEGMLISCVVKNITKAGVRAESSNDVPTPVVVFIAKDHHYNNSQFSEIQLGDIINVRVIGQRFELNDKYVSIIGELIKPKPDIDYKKKNYDNIPKEFAKPKIVIDDE